MATTLTAEGAQQSLTAHVEAKGIEVFLKYGPQIGWGELQRLLLDRAYVRYPCAIEFDAAPLLAGEFAYPKPKGELPEEGFTMFVHPVFMTEPAKVPALVLYAPSGSDPTSLPEQIRRDTMGLDIPHANADGTRMLTVSIGSATAQPNTKRSLAGLIQSADEALYRAKQLGRNHVLHVDSSEAESNTGSFKVFAIK